MSEHDYVIVGAGSAGAALAARLSEDGTASVLLLEAGGSDRSPWIRVPIGYGLTFNDPRYNWMYESEPDPALDGRRSFVPRGKVLGGSSAINAMVYVRGHAGDFDDWAAAGNPGWSWQDVLPYFRRCEDSELGPSALHGRGGPLHVADVSADVHPLCATFLDACRTTGARLTDDFNDGVLEGAGLWQVTIRDGRRVSSASAYLHPARRRANLEVRTHALATRVVLEGGEARAVEYLAGGERRVARARREVVLAAGAINSPQLLQLSGIGEPALLAAHGIPVAHALPAVGAGLQDHLAVSYFYRSRVPTLNDRLAPLWGKVWAGLRYLATRRGPLAMSVNQAGAFLKTRPELARPNMHVYFNPISYTASTGPRRRLLNPDPFPAFLMSFNTCRPTSRGSVAIRSADPREAPAIRTGYLSTPGDVADVQEGARLLRSLAAAPPLAAVIEREYLPGPSVQGEADVLADFRARAGSVYHASCTCAMGPDPARAVVDARLRVHGVGRLRVVDASVFPSVTSGNTNAATIMVAEKAADLMKSR
ncbi:MAG: GMC family oxidoreductase N-terminal domain-containing protein [Proteobacteria bacterium]|nr:GMC family oxidoreductase N-terminal domain-containing protein [Pseudomonadota bacterium]